MTARSVGMVDPAQYMKGTLDSSQATWWKRHSSNLFRYDESVSERDGSVENTTNKEGYD